MNPRIHNELRRKIDEYKELAEFYRRHYESLIEQCNRLSESNKKLENYISKQKQSMSCEVTESEIKQPSYQANFMDGLKYARKENFFGRVKLKWKMRKEQ